MAPQASPDRWQLPPLGGVAAEDVPGWLVEAMILGVLSVNRLGGFTLVEGRSTSCMAGDTVIRGPDGSIRFEVQDRAFTA